MTLRARAALALIVGILGASSSRAQTPTAVDACPRNAAGAHPSSGVLEVLPSDVPELALDSMRWSVTTGRILFGRETYLDMGGHINATRETPLAGIGVLFEGRRDTSVVAQLLTTSFYEGRLDAIPDAPAMGVITFHGVRADRATPVHYHGSIGGGQPASVWGCPARARIVRLMNLATHVGLVSLIARDSGALLSKRRATGQPLRPLEVLLDTVIPLAPGMVIGVAVNTTDRTLHDAAVWIVATYADLDTLVWPIGDVAPHALVPFGGGRASGPRYSRGGWTDADPGSRATAEYGNSVGDFRRAKNGTIHRSLRADDEWPRSDHFQWDPANFDLDTALAFGRRGVFAILHGPTASSPRVDFAVIGSKTLYHVAGQSRADSARLTMKQMGELGNAAHKAQSIPTIPRLTFRPPTPEDSAALKVQPGRDEEVVALKFGAMPPLRRLRFPAGHPPAALQPLYDALRQLEEQARARVEKGKGR